MQMSWYHFLEREWIMYKKGMISIFEDKYTWISSKGSNGKTICSQSKELQNIFTLLQGLFGFFLEHDCKRLVWLHFNLPPSPCFTWKTN